MLPLVVLTIRFLLAGVVLSQEWIHSPENVAVVVGNDLTLRCLPKSANGSVKWLFYGNDIKTIPVALTGDHGCLENNYRKYKCSEGNHFLNFNCADKTYAGVYDCNMSGRTTRMQLIILESNPSCSVSNITVVEDNYIEMWCIVNYSGRWAPVMEWGQYVTDNTVQEQFNGDVTNRTTNESVISTLRLLVDWRRHNTRYYCKTYFTNDSILYEESKLAKSVPTFNHTWISPNIAVLYSPKDMKITQSLSIVTSSHLNCSAEANPPAHYTWTDNSSGNINYGPLLLLYEYLIYGQTYTFECVANNYIGQPLVKKITFTWPCKPAEMSLWKVVTINLAGSLFVIIVITVAAVTFVAKKTSRDKVATSTALDMEVIGNEPDENIESAQRIFSYEYETALEPEEDKSYNNLAPRHMSRNVATEERNGATSSHDQDGPYEVPEAVGYSNMVHNQVGHYQELPYDDSTFTRYTQDGPYEVFYLNSP